MVSHDLDLVRICPTLDASSQPRWHADMIVLIISTSMGFVLLQELCEVGFSFGSAVCQILSENDTLRRGTACVGEVMSALDACRRCSGISQNDWLQRSALLAGWSLTQLILAHLRDKL